MQSSIQKMTRAGIIAALYVALCLVFNATSFGVIQFRPAEAFTLLPILFPEAIPGIFIGVLIANLFGGVGLVDIIFGSLISLLAAYLTWIWRHSFLAYLSPIVLNAFLVSLYLHAFFNTPYWYMVLSIGISQSLVIVLLGVPLITYIRKKASIPKE
ncbi:MAG: QueT transporter family protein [Syntrophomonadaceae bacterium]|nr:QueT transporter family protein [Syntrophomonadaceae bacterium]